VQALLAAGVQADRIVVDPGIGFGKTTGQNLALLRALRSLGEAPVLIGVSRKSLIGALTRRPASGRLAGSLGGALAAIGQGASIVRVHDVAATRDLLTVWSAISGAEEPANIGT
jgi:dihydropteroate synthase